MRIIAGSFRGRRLTTPDWPGLRPTSDKLRETIFNILTPRLSGARVLDGFAGTGALGIEALSRGATHVTFMDRDPRAVQLIADHLERFGILERCAIIRADLRMASPPAGPPFDIILLDPPYDEPDLAGATLAATAWAADDAIVVLEHGRRVPPPEHVGAFRRVRQLRSGDSALAIYERRTGKGSG